MALFSMLRLGLTPEVNALGAVVVLGVGAILGLAALLLRPRRALRGEPGGKDRA